MKKFVFIVIAVILTLPTYSQVKCGLKLGADFSVMRAFADGEKAPDSLQRRLTSPRLGFFVEIPVNDFLFIQAGFNTAVKGYKFDFIHYKNDQYVETEDTQLLLYIDFPVTIGYKYDMGDAKLFALAGPALSYNLYATQLYKYKGEYDNVHQTVGSDGDILPIELCGKIEGGIEVNRFMFSASYSMGLSNLAPENPWDMTLKSNVIGLTAAVKFGEVDGRRRGGHRRH
ncbi:MAG TPA: porin family protein [Lentimicrobium sp.]|nr:porin family protein [Lentimicrobium sp.]